MLALLGYIVVCISVQSSVPTTKGQSWVKASIAGLKW